MTNVYDFTLIYHLPVEGGEGVDQYLDALYEAGCDDALIGLGRPGYLAFDFEREADSAEQAMQSAIEAIEKVIPDSELVEAKPDYVGATEIASILGCTRQNVRKHLVDKPDAPAPVASGSSFIWRLCEVVPWLNRTSRLKGTDILCEVARATMKANVEVQTKRSKKIATL